MTSRPIKKFSFAKTQQNNNSNSSCIKKSIPGPTTPIDFIAMAINKYAKLPLLMDMNYRVGFYFCLVSLGSVFFDIVKMPKSYFSNKFNILNQLFAKWAWGWTFTILFCFIVTTNYIISAGNKSRIRQNITRLFVTTSIWYVATGLFHMIENETGDCYVREGNKYVVVNDIKHRGLCKRSDGTFVGFDISGHVFLLTLCNLCIAEEARILILWRKLESFLLSNKGMDPDQPSKMNQSQFITAKKSFESLNMNIKLLTLLMSLISILWDILLIATVVYFHTMPSKFIALLVSSGSWYLTYRIIFPMNSSIFPHSPTSDLQDLLGVCSVPY